MKGKDKMKNILCAVAMVLGFALLADEQGQTLYWQVTSASTALYSDAAYAALFARVGPDGEIIGGHEAQGIGEQVRSNLMSSDWEWGSYDISSATFYLELLNREGMGLGVESHGVEYATLASKYMDINWPGQPPANATASYMAWTFPIPEPTSGVLFLIGLAGLALKRKRLS